MNKNMQKNTPKNENFSQKIAHHEKEKIIREKTIENLETDHIEKSAILEENVEEKKMTPEQIKNLENLVEAINSAGLEEFTEYIRSPWRMLWPNFIAGVARGIGTLIGAAVVIAIIGWFLARLINLPLIGKELEPYVNKIQGEIKKYTESTNYNDNFNEMQRLLQEIRDEMKMQNARR